MKDQSGFLSRVHITMSRLGGPTAFEYFGAGVWEPPVDIYECDNSILVVVELPGVDDKRIDVTVDKGLLRITGFRPKSIPETAQHIHQMEIPYGRFARILHLPQSADVERISARYEQGYLIIEVPRSACGGRPCE